jgi:hypothetical protein
VGYLLAEYQLFQLKEESCLLNLDLFFLYFFS